VSYKVDLPKTLRKRIAEWGLRDELLVEIYLRLQQSEANPAEHLIRLKHPFDGMNFAYSLVDPKDRLTEYVFNFGIRYSQDEQSLHVVFAGFQRRSGF
jgi:hypothetical protein